MKKRLIFGAGIALLALQTATTFADDPMGGGGPPPPESSSSMSSIVPPVSSSSATSSSSSTTNACACSYTRILEPVYGANEIVAASNARGSIATNERVAGCTLVTAPDEYYCTIVAMSSFSPSTQEACTAFQNAGNMMSNWPDPENPWSCSLQPESAAGSCSCTQTRSILLSGQNITEALALSEANTYYKLPGETVTGCTSVTATQFRCHFQFDEVISPVYSQAACNNFNNAALNRTCTYTQP